MMTLDEAAANITIGLGMTVGTLQGAKQSELINTMIESAVVVFKRAGIRDAKIVELCAPYHGLAQKIITDINNRYRDSYEEPQR